MGCVTIVIIVKCCIERNNIVHRYIISHIVHAKNDAYALPLVIHRYECNTRSLIHYDAHRRVV